MPELKFVHCADIHLDAPFSSLGPGKSSIRRQELLHTFQRIIQITREENAGLLLISGDLYEHDYVRRSTVGSVCDLFLTLPDTDIFIIPGNHDPLTANSYYRTFRWPDNVHILDGERPFHILESRCVCVYGAAFRGYREDRLPLPARVQQAQNLFNILLAHGTVDLDMGGGGYNPMNSRELAAAGMDYVALGHFHNRKDNIGGYGILYNPGSPEPLGFDEPGEHGIYAGSLSASPGKKAELRDLRFIRTGRYEYETLEVTLNECSSDLQALERIGDFLHFSNPGTRLVQLVLKGYVDPSYRPDTGFLSDRLEKSAFSIKIKNETLPGYMLEELCREPGLRGLFTRKMLARIEKAEAGAAKAQLMRALYFGLEALDKGVIEGIG